MQKVYKDWDRFSWNSPKHIAENKIAFASPYLLTLSKISFLKTISSNIGANIRTITKPPILPVAIISESWSVCEAASAGDSIFMPVPIALKTLETAYMIKNNCIIEPKPILLPALRSKGTIRAISQNTITPITLGTYISRRKPVGLIILTRFWSFSGSA